MDLGLVQMPVYTAITAAILMLMHIVLMGYVIARRVSAEVNIGDGGDAALEQRIRVHGNYVENTPIFLIGLGLIEMISGGTPWVMGLAGAFVLLRLSHAIGYAITTGASPGRFIGALGTMITIVVAALHLAYLGFTHL